MKTILVTGAAGFIGAWTAKALVERGERVIGVANFNPYYDPRLKRPRVKIHEIDLADRAALARVFRANKIDRICHLGAQAGVRYSLQNPFAYENTNNLGTLNLLETARTAGVRSFVYASSSSVYGGNRKAPFSVKDAVNRPLSLYAATKRANELTAHVYHHLYGFRCTGLRFFTVYGPWGRPDMALFSFTKAIMEGRPIELFNRGIMRRDFTYIDDIVAGVLAALDRNTGYRIYNLGNSRPVTLGQFVRAIENSVGRKAVKKFLPLQPGDVPATWADIDSSRRRLGFRPRIGIEAGVQRFVDWYRSYFRK